MNLAETAELMIHLRLKDEATGALKTATTNTTSLGNAAAQTGGRFTAFGNQVKQGIAVGFGIGTFGLIQKGIGTVTDFLHDSVEAYKEQEVATANLTASLNANVPAWKSQQGAIDAAMKSTINLGFQDDDFAEGLTRVVAATHDVGKALQVMSVAQDLARFKGISLTDASNALTKVEAGRFRLLADLGIKLRDNATEEEALAAVRKVAAGQAIAYTTTLAGKEDILNSKLNEQQEVLGEKLVPAQLALNEAQIAGVTAAGNLFSILESHGKSTQDQVMATRDWFASVKELIPSMGFLTDQVDQATASYVKSDDQVSELARHTTILTGAAEEQAPAWAHATLSQEDFEKQLKDTQDAARDLKNALNTLADDVLDAKYGPRIAAGRLEELKQELIDAQKEQNKFKEGSKGYIIADGRVAQLEEEIARLEGTQKQAAGNTKYLEWLRAQTNQYDKAGNQLSGYNAELLRLIRLLHSVPGSLPGGGGGGSRQGIHPRQFGGPVNPYGTYVVGEGGNPELLHMGSRGGWVTPLSGNHRGGMTGVQPIQVTVLLNTRTVAKELARESSITYARTR